MKIKEAIFELIALKKKKLEYSELIDQFQFARDFCIYTLQSKDKTLFCNNGTNTADAHHLVIKLSERFYYDKEHLFLKNFM